MLIDISRKPIRLIAEECPTVTVVRSMAKRSKASGLIHRVQISNHLDNKKDKAIPPKVTLLNGPVEHIETILPWPDKAPPFHIHYQLEHYVISGFQDQVTKLSGVWRVNFIFDRQGEFPNTTYLLTLFDETNSMMLFTIQMAPPLVKNASLFGITTPLQRYINKQRNEGIETDGLWGALLDDDDGF